MKDEYNIIKPVDALQNIGALKPVKQGDKRKKRQEQSSQKNHNEQRSETPSEQHNPGDRPAPSENGEHFIDYCA